MSSGTPAPLDLAAAVLIGLLALRGLFRGAVREAFALGALVAAVIAVRTLDLPLTRALEPLLAAHFSPLAVRVLASALLVAGAIVVVSSAGSLLRRGLHAAGLGFADRLSGATLGAAEGALLAALGLFGASLLLGVEHPLLRESRSYIVFERVRDAVGGAPASVTPRSTPAVATPPQR
jgi:membrane protein required for colicin V production